jgi:hypothetical protein
MNKNEIIDLLTKGLDNVTLHSSILSALAWIQNSQNVSIGDHRQAIGENRSRLLALYRHRYALLLKRRDGHIEGFEETIRSLAEQDCDAVQLITVEPDGGSVIVSIIVSREDVPIGCFIGRK